MKMNKAIFAILAVFIAAAILVGAGSAAVTIYPYTQLNSSLANHQLQLTSDLNVYVVVDSDAVIRSADFIEGAYKDVTASAGEVIDYYLSYPKAAISLSLVGVDGSDANGKTVSKSSGLKFTVTATGKVPVNWMSGANATAFVANETVNETLFELNETLKFTEGGLNVWDNKSLALSNISKTIAALNGLYAPFKAAHGAAEVAAHVTAATDAANLSKPEAAMGVIDDNKTRIDDNISYVEDIYKKILNANITSGNTEVISNLTGFNTTIRAFMAIAQTATHDASVAVQGVHANSIALGEKVYLMPYALWFTTPGEGTTTFFGSADSVSGLVFDGYNKATFTVNTLAANDVKAGLWTVQSKFFGEYFLSAPAAILNGNDKKSFTVATTTDAITASKDTLVRGNSIIITASGTPGQYVVLEVSKKGLYLVPGQIDAVEYKKVFTIDGTPIYTMDWDAFPYTAAETVKYVVVKLGTTGVAEVQFDTNSNTPDETFKVTGKFYTLSGTSLYYKDSKKDVSFKVEKGSVSIKADADSYYIGNEISVSGTNTETSDIYLYIKGANKDLQQIPVGDDSYVTDSRFGLDSPITVNSDNTWSKKFTIANRFDAGTYSIYAAAEAFDLYYAGETTHDDDNGQYVKTESESFKSKVSYETCAITLKQPFLTATAESNSIAKGDKIKITGTVEGTPESLIYYVFGTNHFDYGTITPEDDGSYSKKIDTAGIATGQYFVVIQHPMYDKLFNVLPGDMAFDLGYNAKDIKTTIYSFKTNDEGKIAAGDLPESSISDLSTRQNANGAEAVCKLIDEEYVDDIYVKLDFIVANAYMTINAVGDQTQGSTFKISGTTNVKVDEDVNIDVVSTKFQAEPKASVSASSYLVQSTKVVAGSNGENTYEATFDGTPLAVDAYTAIASIARTSGDDLKMSTTFNIVKGAATPTGTETAAPTVTTPAEPTQTSTPAKTPGFGALIALAGLGAVAVLVLRRQ